MNAQLAVVCLLQVATTPAHLVTRLQAARDWARRSGVTGREWVVLSELIDGLHCYNRLEIRALCLLVDSGHVERKIVGGERFYRIALTGKSPRGKV